MNKDCAEHENIIVNRVSKLIDEKVEYSITKRFLIVNRWLVGSLGAVFLAIIVIIVSVSMFMGRITIYNEMVQKAMDKQDVYNKSISEEMDAAIINQLFVIQGLKKIDPSFQIPIQTRGKKINHEN